ncbi:hypothetical protein [Photobacterium sp. Alg240-V54]|uniref:hypothetical protein n=1 Tax=Photobacterium sp. Alg240-V54 TaxID=2305995 RepID=UPI0013D0D210|nr:hypothetical protein [Photobacterium sp. Alg240-V54]
MKPLMYIVVEGVIWKITAEGEWIQIPPSEILDSSVPFISEKAQVNDIIKTKNNEDDVVKISTSARIMDSHIFLDKISPKDKPFHYSYPLKFKFYSSLLKFFVKSTLFVYFTIGNTHNPNGYCGISI